MTAAPSVDLRPAAFDADLLVDFFVAVFVAACFFDTDFFDAAFFDWDPDAVDFLVDAVAFLVVPAAAAVVDFSVDFPAAPPFFVDPRVAPPLAADFFFVAPFADFFVDFFAATILVTLPWLSVLLRLLPIPYRRGVPA